MGLTLTVDGPRWRSHLRAVADATPGLVPVVKGNGYGMTPGRLARRSQWAMIRHAIEAGAHVYDLRGITETLDADDPHVGLIQFKVGTGGQAVEYVGEWDLPLNKPLYAAFDLYMRRR